MKALKNIKHLLIIILFSSIEANGQDFNFIPSTLDNYYFNPQNLGTSSPHVSDFIRFGNLNVNLYNGLLDTKIDLENYKDNDFNIPISLNYISNGFTPSKRPSLVGLNWLLNYGGVISREVKGSPDDTRGNYVADPLKYIKDGIYVSIKDGNFKLYSETNLNNFNIDMNNCCDKTPNFIGDFKYDMEPDIFKFSFGNYSGSFLINNSGVPKLLEENGCKINIDSLTIQSYSTTDTPTSSAITVTTPDGFIYIFGGNINYLEYFIPDNPKSCNVRPRYITSWFLRTIEAPNHRKALFTYNSNLQKNKYYNFVCSLGSSRTMTTCVSTNWVTGVVSYPIIPTTINNLPYIGKIDFVDKIFTPVIDNIKIDNTTIKFNAQKTTQGFFDLTDIADKSNFLSNITISNGTNTVKTIDLNYITNNNYFFLNTINNNGLKYQFDYNFNYPSPNPLTISVDHWGFWAGGYDTSPSDLTDYCINIEMNRSVNTNVCDNFLLKKITYPTGGSTGIQYEYNRYTSYFNRNVNLIQLDKYKLENSVPCGGARVKTISDYDFVSNKYVTKNYLYQDTLINGNETGVIGIIPKYVTRENRQSRATSTSWQYITGGSISNIYTSDTYSQGSDISTNTFGSINNFNEYHISYPNVIEINSDNSYTKYTFSSLLDVPDYCDQYYKIITPAIAGLGVWVMYSDLTYPQLAEKHRLYFSNDLSTFRGKLLKKEVYSATGKPVMSVINTYNTDVARSNYNISVSSSPMGYAAYKIFLTPCQIKNRIITDNNSNTTNEDFTYNIKNFINEQVITNSDKSKISIYFNYLFDYIFGISDENSVAITNKLNKNIILAPIEILKIVNRNGNKKISTGVFNKYFMSNDLPLKRSTSELETNTLLDFNTKDYMSKYKEIETFHNYDMYGNITYLTTKDNLNTVYLWSYNGQYPVAEIKNATLDQVKSALGVDPSVIAASSVPDMNIINGLRNSLTGSQVTTYGYKPLVGMTTMTNLRGVCTNYTYDTNNRLYLTRNDDENIISRYRYAYQNNPDNGQGGYSPLAGYVNPGALSYIASPSSVGTAIFVLNGGGTGNLIYNWYLTNSTGGIIWSVLNTTSSSFSYPCQQIGKLTVQCVVTDNLTGETLNSSKSINCYPLLFTVTTVANSYNYGDTGTAICSSVLGGSGSYNYSWYLMNNSGTVLANTLNTSSTSFSYTCLQTGVLTVQCTVNDNNVSGKTTTVSSNITCNPVIISSGNFAMQYGYNIAYNTISSNGTVVSFVLTYSNINQMTVGTNYFVARVPSGCQPSVTRVISYITGGRTWNVTFNPDMTVYCQIVSGTNLPTGGGMGITSTYNL